MREDTPDAAQPQSEPRVSREASAPLVIHELSAGGGETIVEGRELKLSNLAKVLYPSSKFSKRELIDYYAAIAPVLLGHLAGRALTVTRWPDGVEGKSFFQKQAPAHRPEWVRTATIASSSKPIDYTLADDLPTLVWLANLAAIELHTPLALAAAPRASDRRSFSTSTPVRPPRSSSAVRSACGCRGCSSNSVFESFAKTSGSKGLQVYVPLNDEVSFVETKPFAKAVAELLESAEPELVISRMTKARRAGKVLIDWSQNDAKKTTVCVYSLRASERPTASTPSPGRRFARRSTSGNPASLVFEAAQVLERVAEHGDLFAPVLSLVQQLPASG